MIRGRLCDDTKPETFNQLWTVEEQVINRAESLGPFLAGGFARKWILVCDNISVILSW